MKSSLLPCLTLFLALLPVIGLADDFTGFSMEFVDIGNRGNAADGSGFGGVAYNYRISKYEVSRGMIDSYNANSGGGAITMADLSTVGGNGSARPATGVSWNEAARFVNWLNTSQGHSVAYKFTTSGANDNIALWTAADSGFDPGNPFRNSNAFYFLPSEDEWYKAAYYDPNHGGPGVGGYWDYPTGSDSAPAGVANGSAPNTAVYLQSILTGPAAITNAGGLSPLGTMAQGGNAREWTESTFSPGNASVSDFRTVRGGVWNDDVAGPLNAGAKLGLSPGGDNLAMGFRVASIPEPSGFLLAVLGGLGLLLRRRRLS